MIPQANFLSQYSDWYSSSQGSFVLSNVLNLGKEMISPWSRRGHKLLSIGFGHWKGLEELWESGFDVSAITICKEHADLVREVLHHKVDVYVHSFDHIPFEDKSFDYVILNPPPHMQSYLPLEDMLSEAHRLASKGVLLRFLNTLSISGLMRKYHKLPNFLQHSFWHSYTDARKLMRKLAPEGHICAGSTLMGPPNSWRHKYCWHKINNCVMPIPLGALVQLRLNLGPQTPFTGIHLRLDPFLAKGVQPITALERRLEQ